MKQPIYQRDAIVYGLTGGLIYIITHIGAWLIGTSFFITVSGAEKLIPYVIALLIFGGIQLKNKNGGYLPYADALKFAFLAYIIIAIIEAISNYVLYNVLDKNLTATVLQATREKSVQMMQRLGSSKEQIDEALKNVDSGKKETNFKTILLGLGVTIIWNFGKSAIIALIIRKEKPVTE